MASIRKLQRDARATAKSRSHDMTPFKTLERQIGNFPLTQESKCRKCGATMIINLNPSPNQVDIGGEAVALNCVSKL